MLLIPLAWIWIVVLPSRRDLISYPLVAAVAVGLVAVAALLWRRRSARTPGLVQVRLDTAGCLQNDNPAKPPTAQPTAWALIHEVEFDETAGGTYHLRLRTAGNTWFAAETPVDSEVRLTAKQAELLRQWIDTCTRRAS